MAVLRVYLDDVLREEWNDDANPRTVTFWDAAGQNPSTRNQTPAENAAAANRINTARAAANMGATKANLMQDMANMQTIVATDNTVLNNTPAPSMKQMARMLRRLGRMSLNDFDDGAD